MLQDGTQAVQNSTLNRANHISKWYMHNASNSSKELALYAHLIIFFDRIMIYILKDMILILHYKM